MKGSDDVVILAIDNKASYYNYKIGEEVYPHEVDTLKESTYQDENGRYFILKEKEEMEGVKLEEKNMDIEESSEGQEKLEKNKKQEDLGKKKQQELEKQLL